MKHWQQRVWGYLLNGSYRAEYHFVKLLNKLLYIYMCGFMLAQFLKKNVHIICCQKKCAKLQLTNILEHISYSRLIFKMTVLLAYCMFLSIVEQTAASFFAALIL